MRLVPRVSDGDYLAAGDAVGTASAPVGRFVPDRFTVATNTPVFQTACLAGGYGYVGQPFTYAVAPLREMVRSEIGTPKSPAVRLEWEVRELLPTLYTDQLKLRVIVKNLVENALKFTDAGFVRVSVQAKDDGVELAVSDSGIGIAPDAQSAIFEAFRQLDGSSTRRHGGVGLGRYIVHRLVDMLGGTIGLSSVPGRGSSCVRAMIASRSGGSSSARGPWLAMRRSVAAYCGLRNGSPACKGVPSGREKSARTSGSFACGASLFRKRARRFGTTMPRSAARHAWIACSLPREVRPTSHPSMNTSVWWSATCTRVGCARDSRRTTTRQSSLPSELSVMSAFSRRLNASSKRSE